MYIYVKHAKPAGCWPSIADFAHPCPTCLNLAPCFYVLHCLRGILAQYAPGVWCGRSFGPFRLWSEVSVKDDCFPQMSSGPIRSLSVDFEHFRFFAVFFEHFLKQTNNNKKTVEGPTADLLGKAALGGERCSHVEGIIGLLKFFGRCKLPKQDECECQDTTLPHRTLHCFKMTTFYSCV